ncbi:hypothetical protein CLI64_10200 [Nostoc sp. CENA543]|uniref:DUF4168 domain-containing protein n=1 Tax=Nostoc sp. CENA543 TaxID=1869241 RepID=UPI000CA3D5D4|nr:DUF4168 domain-containing protein [Nostoc sp. CENA543]AUT00739.1 hypothetical protein CLI64_10200 [Nostoc sp. CENA543]
MESINNWGFPKILHKRITHSLFLGLITATSLFVSTWNTKALAQNLSVSNNDIVSYAQALLAIEPVRQQAFREIKRIIGSGNIPQIVCNEPDSINSLTNQEARDVARNYCKDSQAIVEDKGLTIEKFNKITVEISRNNGLKKRVYDQLLQLQQRKSLS